MPGVNRLAVVLLAASAAVAEPPGRPLAEGPGRASGTKTAAADSVEGTKPPRLEDKTLVASLDVVQGNGKDRVSLYRDGTLALVKTYEGVRTVKRKVVSEEEVDFVRRVCSEALVLDVAQYQVDVLGRTEPRRFRVEVGRPDDLPRVFEFDELARVPLVLGRARSALEGLLGRFDENVVSEDDLWDPADLRVGDVLTSRNDGRKYRIVRDDTFVRSLEMVEEERALQRLVILREDVPRLFLVPPSGRPGPAR